MAGFGEADINAQGLRKPCTQDELMQAVSDLVSVVINITEMPPSGDAYTVLVTANDSTPSVLHDAIEDNATYVANEDLLVTSATVGASGTDQAERFFVDSSIIASYTASGTVALCLVNGVKTWVNPSTFVGADSFKVKVSAADTTEEYLHTSMVNQATYDADPDIPIYAAINSPAGNEKLQLFIDASTITGYSGTGVWALCEVDGVPTFVDLDVYVSGGVVEGYATDISRTGASTIDFDPTELQGFAATWQFFMHLSGDSDPDGVTSPHWLTVGSYDNTKTQVMVHVNGTWSFKTVAEFLNLLPGYVAGNNQIIGHAASGDTEWKTLIDQVINNPDDLTLDADSLDLEYTPYTFKVWPAADDGTPAVFSVDVEECP